MNADMYKSYNSARRGGKKEADKRKKEGSEVRERKVGHNDGK